MAVNIQFDPSSGSQNQTVKVSGGCNPGIDETIQFQVQTEDGSKTEIINVTQEGKREVLMVSDGQGGYTEFMPSDGGTFNVVKEEWKENPDCLENGIYVYTVYGDLVKPSEWDTANNDQAAGVAVVDTNCRFAISKSLPMVNNIAWSAALYGVDLVDLINYNSGSDALSDYSGKSNTDAIISQSGDENSSNNAAHYCRSQVLNNQQGYLPSGGELGVFRNNQDEIDNILITIGSQSIGSKCDEFNDDKPMFWSSTEKDSQNAFRLWLEVAGSSLVEYRKNGKYPDFYAFPFFPLVETVGGGITPEEAPNGVYVYTNDGRLYNPQEWDTVNNDQAIGVAVIDTDCQFVISRYLPIGNSIRWSFTLGNIDVDGILNAYSTDEAKTDYAGQNNTSLINARSNESSNYCAASYCYNKTLNGQHGYLPAAGELYVLSENRSEVNNALTVIGASTIDAAFDVITESTGNSFHRLWSSTENLKHLAWYLEWEREPSYLNYYNKTDDYTHWNAFPFFPLTETGGVLNNQNL